MKSCFSLNLARVPNTHPLQHLDDPLHLHPVLLPCQPPQSSQVVIRPQLCSIEHRLALLVHSLQVQCCAKILEKHLGRSDVCEAACTTTENPFLPQCPSVVQRCMILLTPSQVQRRKFLQGLLTWECFSQLPCWSVWNPNTSAQHSAKYFPRSFLRRWRKDFSHWILADCCSLRAISISSRLGSYLASIA